MSTEPSQHLPADNKPASTSLQDRQGLQEGAGQQSFDPAAVRASQAAL
ncbi:hypothetical protein [Deinococcus sp. QL22]|nr:hypothetical protein [Deinococcus sp. QL22]UQN09309.1 hypothetical protein M1R55_22315 [Deinococcus sp. QL22]